jgi:hypothetical protein
MKMPEPVWAMTYASSQRKHRHRCWSCNKVVKEGEAVLMARVASATTRCMHEACAARPYGGTSYDGRDFLEAWGMQYLAGVGHQAARSFLASSPICRAA